MQGQMALTLLKGAISEKLASTKYCRLQAALKSVAKTSYLQGMGSTKKLWLLWGGITVAWMWHVSSTRLNWTASRTKNKEKTADELTISTVSKQCRKFTSKCWCTQPSQERLFRRRDSERRVLSTTAECSTARTEAWALSPTARKRRQIPGSRRRHTQATTSKAKLSLPWLKYRRRVKLCATSWLRLAKIGKRSKTTKMSCSLSEEKTTI